MPVLKTIKPNSPGAQRFTSIWGDRLVAVRYRENPLNNTIQTTIELIVDERARAPEGTDQKALLSHLKKQIVAVDLARGDDRLRSLVMHYGAQWSNQLRLWLMSYDLAVAFALRENIVNGAAQKCTDVDISLL